MPTPAAIEIQGLAEFRRNLGKLNDDLPKAMREALKSSAELVQTGTQRKMPSLSGRARRSVKIRTAGAKVGIREGGDKAPWVPWLDFGGRVGRSKSVVRQVIADGRYLYDTFYENQDETEDLLSTGLIEVARQAGIEMT